MCEELGADDLGPSHAYDSSAAIPASRKHAPPDRDAIPTEAVR
jgi:hypothetical protein